ncbi:hypothetical protein BC941DRAFT_346050 [Chlamydoabsidia padenii]|nr:hypothetical protein BC941DRAFT_346050 [Chlamydoabsidia padenii]
MRRIAQHCPQLQHVRFMGFFSDTGLLQLADHCHLLQVVHLSLPNGLVQSNTITHIAIDQLAISCPLLTRVTCLGQIRIDPVHAERTFRSHCSRFAYCDFGIDA